MSDYQDDDDEEEDLKQGYPLPLFKPSRRPKAGKHWVISMFNPSHKPSQGVPVVPRTQTMLRESLQDLRQPTATFRKQVWLPKPHDIVAQPFMFAHANCGLRFAQIPESVIGDW